MTNTPDNNDLFENPLGLDGFEFIEFASPKAGVLEPVFEMMGFTKVATHRSKDVDLYRQGNINFIINREKNSLAKYFAEEHGPSACGMAFRVKDSRKAYKRALELGAQPIDITPGPMELRLPAIKGIGNAPIYLIDRYVDGAAIYDIDFEYVEGVDRHPEGCGFHTLDHLTHNVYRGRMKYWANYYEKLFNFREIRYFDIKGEYTGLTSKAMTAPDGKIRIPLNEEGAGGSGQIEEFLMAFNGEGIQHIALACDDLYACWDRLKANGMPFMTAPPETYYEMLEQRLPGHGEPLDELKSRGILLDGTTGDGSPRLLLQIFSDALLGPVFFEFIQRKQDDGFGEGNFKALFESIERDQINRGVLKTN
ncbi:4-hydroxyphenylpyruvate dioxygenase [Leucothrix mucor]|uniref:4-hydroxyphenylpyruvate dioxygenase n=1 Tax=Leucothrix mucor TaxID=45248 RepID=UPI0003B448FF|nr:4-hydroxyphenylpyruvate dioxygenase [Leucothrix mucor]